MQKKRALISGINGMDGSHLAELLIAKGYEVFGLEKPGSESSRINTARISDKIVYLTGDLTDTRSILACINEAKPHEVYNLAAQSFLEDSWGTPEIIADTIGLGVLRMLESIREYGDDTVKFYQASSSEMFGRVTENPANEETPFYPRTPYGVAKLYGHWMCKNYRELYGMYTCSGILFNHESERRRDVFVSRKITSGVAKIHLGLADSISLGNITAARDWGYAPDYVEGMWLMLQQEKPDDYVLATGKIHTIEQFLNEAFSVIGIADWSKYVQTDPNFNRIAEVDTIKGNYDKAKKRLGWEPRTSFKDFVSKMVIADIDRLK
jgi:GDPmannose 4,6-dehydratase